MAVVRTGKTAVKGVPTPGRTSFVLGSRPPALRSPRIKPLGSSTTQYGKDPMAAGTGGVSGAGFGSTGLTGET